MDQAAYDRTVSVATEGKVLTKPPVDGYRNDLAQQALANLGGDTMGTGYTKPSVPVTEGGK